MSVYSELCQGVTQLVETPSGNVLVTTLDFFRNTDGVEGKAYLTFNVTRYGRLIDILDRDRLRQWLQALDLWTIEDGN